MKFWESKSLDEMSSTEWESLCDGCAQCCTVKLEDADTGEVHHTSMVCDYLDLEGCRCTDYANRHTNVPDCVVLTVQRALEFTWLPYTCAYRVLAEGRSLPTWHPLISGDPSRVHAEGVSVLGRVVHQSEVHPDDQQDMILTWVDRA